MLGSILVPNGSFESHVSTNGRVYVGQDFMMYNPTAIGYESTGAGWEGKTASVLNMDQERHNLPWNGQMIANCPAIQWNKANSAGEALEGTTWKVYGTLEAAKAGTPSLAPSLMASSPMAMTTMASSSSKASRGTPSTS